MKRRAFTARAILEFQPDMEKKLPAMPPLWWLCIAVVVLWTAAVQRFQWNLLYFTGDEPHYMMSVVSFVLDRDFNNLNNYQRADYKRFGVQELGPQFSAYGFERPDMIPAEHGTVFPILITPAFVLGGVDGVRIFLLVLSAAACLTLGAAVWWLSDGAATGALAGVLLAIAPTWQMQSSRIYPESTAGFLATVVLLILARHARNPDRRPNAAELFIAGFLTAFIPLLYTKYAAISAGLAVALLLMPAVRVRRSLWAGMAVAVALGVANIVVWGEEGALTGNTSIHQSYNFVVSGWISRYFRPLFDRHHGIVPFQPFIFLFLWAMTKFLRLPEASPKRAVLCGAAVSVLLYTVLHGVWIGAPGYSVPGRYLTAVLPLMCGLIAMWAMQDDRWRYVRLGLIGAGAVVAIAFYVVAMMRDTPPYYVLWTYTYLFPRYWDSWDAVSKAEIRPVGAIDYVLPLLLLVTTKGAAMWFDRRPAPAESPEPLDTIESAGP